MYLQVKKWISILLAVAVSILTLLAILSIWGYLEQDVSGKSISTLGILVFSSIVILLVFRIMEDKKNPPVQK